METQMGEKHIILSYNKKYIHRKHRLPNYPAPTRRRPQILFTGSNLKEATTP